VFAPSWGCEGFSTGKKRRSIYAKQGIKTGRRMKGLSVKREAERFLS